MFVHLTTTAKYFNGYFSNHLLVLKHLIESFISCHLCTSTGAYNHTLSYIFHCLIVIMSQAESEADPIRRRAGLISALVKLYVNAQKLMDKGGSAEDAQQLQDKLQERYVTYLESHEIALATYPDREETLTTSHVRSEQRHQQLLDNLEAYIADGTKPDDLESLHAASLFSRRSSAKNSIARSCPVLRKADTASRLSQPRSATMIETRVQAEMAKRRFAQQQAEVEAHQRKIVFELEIARQNRELDKRRAEADARERRLQEEAELREQQLLEDAARKQQELKLAAEERERQMQREARRNQEELEMRQRQIQLDFERQQRELQEESAKRKRELDLRQRELQEEAELYERQLEKVLQMKKKQDEMENLQAELKIREQEEIRADLGSDYDSDGDRVDVTRKEKSKPKHGYQLENEQNTQMQDILRAITDDQLHGASAVTAKRNSVKDWLQDPANEIVPPTSRFLANDSRNLDADYVPRRSNFAPDNSRVYATAQNTRPTFRSAAQSAHRDFVSQTLGEDNISRPCKMPDHVRDTDLSSDKMLARALLDRRLPKPKQLTFDGDPKRYKMFMASFQSNIEETLGDDEDKLKLTLLLQHCNGPALSLIEDCVMLPPSQGYAQALKKLEKRFGKSHLIARSYIDSVKNGKKISLDDTSALVQLADDMEKCQTVLSELHFTSDLDSTGTLVSIIQRLPDCFQTKWIGKSNKILNSGREPTFKDLSEFVEERADEFSSKYGQSYAEQKAAYSKTKPQQTQSSKPKETKQKSKVTTLATAGASAGSTAGPASSVSSASDKQKTQCGYCDIPGHFIGRCYKFKKIKRDEKLDVIKSKNLCYCCLKSGHGTKECEKRCVKCDKKHHVLIHEDSVRSGTSHDQSKQDKSTAATESVTLSTSALKNDAAFGALPVRVRLNNKEKLVVALIDSGSNTTLVRRALVDELGITGDKAAPVAVHTMNGPALQNDQIVCKLELLSDDRSSSVLIDEAMTVPAIPVRAVVDGKAFNEWPHLRDLELPYIPRIKIDIIIGTDCPEMHRSLEERHAGRKDPIARRTPLGWIVLGPSEKTNSVNSFATSVGLDPLTEQLRQISLLDFQDTNVSEPAMSVDDRRALKKMEDTAKIVNGKYQVGIPWKDNPDEVLQNNRSMAESRLRMLKRKFAADPKLAEDYSKTVEAYIADRQAKLVEEDLSDEQSQWFLPHHAVFKRSNPSKCRVVFDCAAQYRGVSLNDAILQGPNFLNNLAGVLIRFRKEPVAVIGDIKLMFHQCFVEPNDTRFLRFLWWPGGDTSQSAKVYAMQVHLFGGKSSPSVVNYCMRKTADDNELNYSELAINTLRRSFYMDDMIRSVKSVEEARRLIPEMEKLLEEGGFSLGKFMSTSRDVIESVPEEKRAKSLQNLDLKDCSLPQESALGLKWNVEGDYFTYAIALQDKPISKRGLLSTTASLYDPLGLVAPVLLVPKLIQQEMCRLNMEWDEELPHDRAKDFEKWKASVSALEQLRIPRCFQPGPSDGCKIELHVFSDASEFAYGAVMYLKVIGSSGVYVNLLMGKSRVAPLKVVSIPRLELTAATLAAKLSRFVMEELDVADLAVWFWTDSMTVLRYLRNVSTRFKTFVAHRVQQIQDITDINSWNYVPTDKNPADLASRGMCPEDEQKLDLWLNGPKFLKENSMYIALFEEPNADEFVLETRQCGVSCRFDVLEDMCLRYSNYHRLKRAVCWLVKFWEFLLNGTANPELSLAEITRAEEYLLRMVQKKAFSAEISALHNEKPIAASSHVRALFPTMRNGLVCVGGRLQSTPVDTEAHPIILPEHHLTELIIREVHDGNGHIGANQTLATIRRKFYLLRGYKQVKRVLSNCVKCRKHHGQPMQQLMGDLPKERVAASQPPFTFVGVDYFGPFNVKYRRSTVKRYGCLFTCLSTRAVHIEIAHSMDSDAFIMALQRFIARRGKPSKVVSDNGTNFVGAEKELADQVQQINSKRVDDEMLLQGIEWQFNPPHAPHMGGVWERIIKSVKGILLQLVGHRLLNDEELLTFMSEVEKILNDRPLTRMGSDARDATPLTPNHLLLLRSNGCESQLDNDDHSIRRRWKTVQRIANAFFERFIAEYLPTLQTRSKWTTVKDNLKINDVVLVVDEDSPRGQWPLGLVLSVETSNDGLVRAAEVRCNGKTKRRPIAKLVFLERHES